jgi:hypothetical protein
MARGDPDKAARIVLSFIAGQPLLKWAAEILNRYAKGNNKPSFSELATVIAHFEKAIKFAPPELAAPLEILVAPLREIRSQIIEGLATAGPGARINLNVPLDRFALQRAAVEVLQWTHAHGYKYQGTSDVPDTVPEAWT